MIVSCQIVHSTDGYEGVVTALSGVTLYQTGQQGCAEDADGLMAGRLSRQPSWRVVSPQEMEAARARNRKP